MVAQSHKPSTEQTATGGSGDPGLWEGCSETLFQNTKTNPTKHTHTHVNVKKKSKETALEK